jgi:Tol biopolymer transport system component
MSLRRTLSPRRAALLVAALVLGACSKNGNDPEPLPERLVASRGNSIVTMDIDGGNQREYTGVPSVMQYGQHPSWGPGRTRVFVHTRTAAGGPGTRIHAVDLQSGNVTVATPESPLGAEWYPRVAAGWVYFMGESAAFEMWRMRPDGSGLAKVPATTPAYDNYYRPVLSPDGRRLAVSTVEGGVIGVRVFDAGSGQAISPWVASATAPRWSPNSRQVAMSTPGGGPIRIMNADGSSLRAVSTAAYDEWFDWRSNGEWLVAANASGLQLVRVSDGSTQAIAGTAGMWQPAVAP